MRRASGIPHALIFLGGRLTHNSGASRREIADAHLNLSRCHCEEQSDEAIQFTMPRYGLLRFARSNDDKTTCVPAV